MAKQVTLDGVELKGVNLLQDEMGMRIQVHYAVLSGGVVYRVQARDVTADLDSSLVNTLNSAWDTIRARVKSIESI